MKWNYASLFDFLGLTLIERHKNENGLLAMVGTGEHKILSLIPLFQRATDTVSRLNRRKEQSRGARGVAYPPIQENL